MSYRLRLKITMLSALLVMVGVLAGCSGSKPNPDLNLGGIDIAQVFSGIMDRVPSALNSIKSMEDIGRVQDELKAVSFDLDDLIFNSEKLSDKGQMDLSLIALGAASELDQLTKMVNESPVYKDKLGGVMEEITVKLKQLI